MLKKCINTVSPFLSGFFRECLKQGVMPKQRKQANIVPIHKGGKYESITNYRPISLLSCTSKILERIVCDPLTHFLTANNIIGNQQFGFSKGTSTIDQLLEMYHRIVSTMDRRLSEYHFGLLVNTR